MCRLMAHAKDSKSGILLPPGKLVSLQDSCEELCASVSYGVHYEKLRANTKRS